MKKTLILLAGLVAVSTAGADSVGLRGGYYQPFYSNQGTNSNTPGSGSIGFQYAYSLDALSTVRGALDLFPNMYGLKKLGFGGEVAYLRKIPGALSTNTDMNVYVGGGLGVNYVGDSASESGVSVSLGVLAINPTVLAGVNYVVNPQFSVYGELAGGVSFVKALGSVNGNTATSESITGGFVHPRIGVTYTIR